MKEKTASRYFMHKYWGKKPAEGISPLIDKYSEVGDTVIDPFSGYGVLCCEAFLKNRNVIVNDLNPAANFIAKNLFSKDVNIAKVKKEWESIKKELKDFVNDWYTLKIDGIEYSAISVLRTKSGLPIQFKYKTASRKTEVMDIPRSIATEFCEKEEKYKISDWYPNVSIIENSRISAYPNMTVADLFTKRTLACHAKLYALIDKFSEGAEKDLFLIAFTANLANCSRLVPPIKSRGALAQGAWMTGFYIGETFIENNVLHYFENRLSKAIKGKENYLSEVAGDLMKPEVSSTFRITNDDAKSLNLPDNSVDYVFTDPPYGDSVPYFEQSVKSFSEIRRVLKDNKFFSLTFHSLSGMEWKAISNACVFNNFIVVDYEWLEQKTYPPRQLNRLKSIKGDVLVTFQKKPEAVFLKVCDDLQLIELVKDFITKQIQLGIVDTNGIMMAIMEWVLREMIMIGDVDVFKVLNENYHIGEDGNWSLNN